MRTKPVSAEATSFASPPLRPAAAAFGLRLAALVSCLHAARVLFRALGNVDLREACAVPRTATPYRICELERVFRPRGAFPASPAPRFGRSVPAPRYRYGRVALKTGACRKCKKEKQ